MQKVAIQKLKIGSIIEIGVQEKLINNLAAINNISQSKINYIDTYIITQITHKATILANITIVLRLCLSISLNFRNQNKLPNAKLQEAIVVDNNDPKGTGRIV